MIQTGIDSQF